MSSFKGFRIWMGWLANKYYGLSLLLAFFILLCGIVGFMYFWGLRLLDMTDNPAIPSNPILGIVFGIVGSSLYFSIFAAPSGHFHASNNWRLAIEDALKFLKKYPACKSKIENSIRHTKDAKDGSEMNKWMENYKRMLVLF